MSDTATIQMRINKADKRVLQAAAKIERKSLSAFLRQTAYLEAMLVLEHAGHRISAAERAGKSIKDRSTNG